MRPLHSCAVISLAALAAVSCSGGGTAPEGMGRVVLQIATTSAATVNGPAAADVVVTKGANSVVINSVDLVARKIRLRRVDASCPADPDQEDAPAAVIASGSAHEDTEHENEVEDHDCPVLKLGPLLLTPPLTDGAATTFSADVPVGTYSKLRIQIHKPKLSRDAAFVAANPDFAGVSIRVKGTFNGTPFTFVTDIEEEEEIVLPHPVEVTTAGTTAFTLFLDVRGWFLDQTGAALIDPSSPTSRSLIEHNIRVSFRAFRDDDHDGEDDEHEGH